VVHRLSGIGFKILLDLVASSPRPVRLAEAPYRFGSRLHGRSKLDVSVAIEHLLLMADKRIGDWIPARFALFVLAGTFGLVAHLLVLGLALSAGAAFREGQIAATLVAMTLNFAVNNVTTHRDRRLRGWDALRGLAVFYLACSLGAISNIALAKMLFERGVPWYLAGGVGLVVGSVWNYAATSVLSWRRQWVRRQHIAVAQRAETARDARAAGGGIA
ncbi:MAG: GtrA family protein, partial [Bryobacterales bacterium]|nr:GtrA family protein [Bryobacterales bacterium]